MNCSKNRDYQLFIGGQNVGYKNYKLPANTVLKNKDLYGVNLCIKFGDCNIGLEGEKLSLLYCMAFLLAGIEFV